MRRTPPLAARLKDIIVFGAVSSLPLAGVLAHNWTVSGALTARRGKSGQSLSDGLCQIGEVFREWVVPSNGLDGLDYLLWTAAGLVVVADRTASPRWGLELALPLGVFALRSKRSSGGMA